jgi:hypothetical protein
MSASKELVGTQLGHYTVVDHLATGGMAEIYLAQQEALGQFKKDLVLKVLQTRWEEHPEVVELFLGEARISALMKHPNIVDVWEVAEENGRHFIAMEHIAGRTLTELAKRAIQVTKSIPVEVGVYIAAEMAGALAYMYEGFGRDGDPLHVVHRDISPTNILISTTGLVKLIDFGIARQGLQVVQESGARPGKVTYMSPEQVQGAPIDGRSDIFCLGTILYEITLGRRLWRGPREVASRRIVEERPKPPTFVRHDYPAELELIVLRALEKRPEDRYQTATELHADLQNFLANSNAHLRSSFQMADYVAKIFSAEADALISDAGRKRADAFVEGREVADNEEEELDFDRARVEGPGAALARALRTSALGVWAEVGRQGGEGAVEPTQPAGNPAAPAPSPRADDVGEPIFAESAADLRRAAKSTDRSTDSSLKAVRSTGNSAADAAQDKPNGKSHRVLGPEETASVGPAITRDKVSGEDQSDHVPRRWNGVIVVGIILAAALGMAAMWWLRSG